ncbi:ion-translocating NADH:ferredoxin oxidoreductase complex Rnf, FMN-binding membrane protein subunit RnfG [Syntrophotalea carbinolica DSM 2380]|uniref:Ion-translocating oxidoreductase complex subunit G n=1 Tax=Syntrophotalea carbinolica (strain DSM 2380 / NBRC 103641 / GraBd1) TaxID=338963 RepID=Q3A7X0_SYNC1|nr:RnfABCDGE type electron transport complex subunit G [Syntrophotalea carbinolica]ABA87522.1 ion-translocating NADH:ferredoxin oxidoreductase complex Rnf, FMN-binding membrane protein subunit RnfG [Syntrophotalea carbinolica DSM 2380]
MSEGVRFMLVLTLITALSGLLLGVTERCTRQPIIEQHARQQRTALGAVLPAVDNTPDKDTVTLPAEPADHDASQPTIYYRGRRQGRIVGIAFKVVAQKGYGGPISMMVGVAPDGTLLGLEILHQTETPGLGNRIEEPAFRQRFLGKGLTGYRWRVRKDGGDFDQISGATISSRAVVAGLAEGLQKYRSQAALILADTGAQP